MRLSWERIGKMLCFDRDTFETWDSKMKAVQIGTLRERKRSEKATVEERKIGPIVLSHPWHSRKERLASGDQSCGNNAPSSRGRVVLGLTAKAGKN